MTVRVTKKYNSKYGTGELEEFDYQMALGISVRKFEGVWAIRIYFLKWKIWFNFHIMKERTT